MNPVASLRYPNPLNSGKDTAEAKGDHREVEAEEREVMVFCAYKHHTRKQNGILYSGK